MRKLIFTLLIFTLTISLAAQDKAFDNKAASKKGWKTGATLAFNVGQGGSRNWAAGSERFSLQGAVQFNFRGDKTWRKNIWENNVDFGYGLVNTNKLGFRKTDDKIDFTSLFRHSISKGNTVGIGAWFNLRTQFHHGYDYNETPKRRISGLMAPGYLTGGPGFDIRPMSSFSFFVSPVAPRMILFTNRPYSFNYQGGVKPDGSQEIPLSWHYNVDPVRKVRFELGALLSAKYHRDIAKNVNYRTRVDLFSNYIDDPQNIDVFWSNYFNMKVNRWLIVNYCFDLIYDDDVKLFGPLKNHAAAQLRSQLGVGFQAKL